MPKSKKTIPIYEYQKKVNGQTRYYIRPYVKDENGNIKQITKRLDDYGNMWLGKEGYNKAIDEISKQQKDVKCINNKKIDNNDLFNMFLEHKMNKIDDDSLMTIKNRLELHFLPTEGNKKIVSYNSDNYKKWQDKIMDSTYIRGNKEKKYSLSFLNAIHSYINAMYELALDKGLIQQNPIRKVGKFGTKKMIANQRNKKKYNIISYEQYLELLDISKYDQKYNTMFDLFYSNGPRPGELMAFRWVDYSYQNSTLEVNHTMSKKKKGKKRYLKEPKTPASKDTMPLDSQLNEKIYQWKLQCMKNSNFTETWFMFGKDEPISENSLCNAVDKYLIQAGIIKEFRLHDFRHSFASWLISLKLPITVVSKRLRHASINETMQTYVHLIPKDYFDSISYIDSIKSSTRPKQDHKVF